MVNYHFANSLITVKHGNKLGNANMLIINVKKGLNVHMDRSVDSIILKEQDLQIQNPPDSNNRLIINKEVIAR